MARNRHQTRAAARRAAQGLLIALILGGCARAPAVAPPGGTASADDVGAILLQPLELAGLFDAPPTGGFLNPDGTYQLSIEDGGVVQLPSGAVVASDPGFEIRPFVARLPPGVATVRLLRAAPPGGSDSLVADAVLTAEGFGDRLDSLTWENAYREGDDPSSFGSGDVVMYSVDSGSGSFTSAEAISAMKDDATFFDRLLSAEQKVGFNGPASVPVGDGLDIVVFPSGAGDGGYPTWVGRAEDGSVVAFLTDFAILAHPAAPASASPGPAGSPGPSPSLP
jgi:hypothetical protein